MSGVIHVFTDSIVQFAVAFGCFLAAAAVLTLLSRWTNNAIRQSPFPEAGTYLFGWIGVPVHEFSHALFCKVFLHKVTAVKWFDRKGKGGAQGSVTHTYHPWNLYHRTGHFFIGLGPVLLCPFAIGILYWALVPGAGESIRLAFANPFTSGQREIFRPFLLGHATASAGTWVFLYLSAAICSQVELSREDLKQVAVGTVPLLLILLVLNTGAWAFHWRLHSLVLKGSLPIRNAAVTIFGFASLVALVTFLVCVLVCGISNLVCGRPFGNPFRGS